ncbi:MAG: hypothetical protein HRT69_02070 [Flavobacteriaceae bacterium]|nr:hypothetical protein [Flavobacteriaceae bacterium]
MSNIINVNIVPKMIFRTRLILGFRIIDNATIIEGIAITIDAINNLVGLSKIFSPVNRLFTFSGT